MDNERIQKMKADLETYRASKQGSISATSTPPKKTGDIAKDLEAYRASKVAPVEQPKEPGFLKSLAADVVRPFARFGTNLVNTAQVATGNAPTQPFSGDFLGEVTPVGVGKGSIGKDLKDIAGATAEIGSYGVGGGGAAKLGQQGFKTLLKEGFKEGAKVGTQSGLLYGAGKELQNTDSTLGNVAKESLLMGGAGLVGGGVLGSVAPVIGAGIRKATESPIKRIESSIIERFEKGIKPTLGAKTTKSQADAYNKSIVSAVKTIKENQLNLSFTDDAGNNIVGETPKSLQQLGDALEQTKKTIFTKYDTLAKEAGEAGVSVDLKEISNELDTVINSKALGITNPRAIQYAIDLKNRLIKTGKLDATTAQEVVQNYNKSLEAFYRNPNYDTATQAAIDSMIANRMRKSLDEGISGLTGSQYQALKNQYGALKAIEKDVVKAALRDARKNVKGLIDFTDIFSGGQVVSGIVSLNPAMIAQGITQKAIASIYKYLTNPNRAVEKMFKAADKLPPAAQLFNRSSTPAKSLLQTQASTIKPTSPSTNAINNQSSNKILPIASAMKNATTESIIPKNIPQLPKTPAKLSTDLLSEAKKYKSAEEFVKAQGTPVYHGTKTNIDIKDITAQAESRGQYLGNGIYFTKFKDGADLYGGKTLDAIVSEKDFLNISNLKGIDRTNKIGSWGTYKQYLKNSNLEDTVINFKKWQKNQQEVADKILNMGYKGVTDGQQHVIFDKSALKTKSQLEEIWKQAQGKLPAKPPKLSK